MCTARAEATGKPPPPSVERLDGTTSMAVSAERRRRRVSTSEWGVRRGVPFLPLRRWLIQLCICFQPAKLIVYSAIGCLSETSGCLLSECRQTFCSSRYSYHSFCLILTKLAHMIYVSIRKKCGRYFRHFDFKTFGEFFEILHLDFALEQQQQWSHLGHQASLVVFFVITRNCAVAKSPRDASCLYSFNTKRRAQSFIISCFGFRYTTAYN